MIIFRTQWQRWVGETVIVMATGPSFRRPEAIGDCKVIAVNDAYKLFPEADILYACDERWWEVNIAQVRETCKAERWSSHSSRKNHDDKIRASKLFDLWLVGAQHASSFCLDGSTIHYGGNSGFQAINLALLFGAKRVLMLGFDMMLDENKNVHYFGNHPAPLHTNHNFWEWIGIMNEAAARLPSDIEIINCSERTALTCFPRMSLQEALTKYVQIAA